MRFLLRPSWLALIASVIAFVVACYALLAPWQFGRQNQRDAEQHQIDVTSATAPAPLAQVLPPGAAVGPGTEWRQVTVTGSYQPQDDVLVRLRVYDGKPAVEVITPLQTADGRLVAVDRGYVNVPNGSQVAPYPAPPTGQVTVTARLRANQTDPDHRPILTGQGRPQLYVTDSRGVAAATRLPVDTGGYLQLAADQPGVLAPLPVEPAAAAGGAPFTNFSYALQWLTFGAIALFALVYFVRLELLQRHGNGPAKAGSRREDRAALRRALAGEDDPPPTP